MKAIHPHPWTASEGTIREVNGYVIGNYAYTLGDHLDHNSGELMAKAPELREAAALALRTIGDTLRHEELKPGNREALQAMEKVLRKAIT